MLIQIAISIVSVILLLVLFYRFWFLRDPERKIPEGENIVSPADGKVIEILKLKSDKFYIEKGLYGKIKAISKDVDKAGYLISIFMNPFDVHVQRAPINGRIRTIKYTKGKFLPANNLAIQNENNQILIQDIDAVKVIQIAGLLVRRIECFVKVGDHILKGEKIGRINLGSQVCVIVPKYINLKIKVGDRVKAGETVIGE